MVGQCASLARRMVGMTLSALNHSDSDFGRLRLGRRRRRLGKHRCDELLQVQDEAKRRNVGWNWPKILRWSNMEVECVARVTRHTVDRARGGRVTYFVQHASNVRRVASSTLHTRTHRRGPRRAARHNNACFQSAADAPLTLVIGRSAARSLSNLGAFGRLRPKLAHSGQIGDSFGQS